MSPIERDIQDLPRGGGSGPGGWQRDPDPVLGRAAAEGILRRFTWADREEKPRDYIRPSDAGKCSRQLSYISLGVPGEPMDIAGIIATQLGNVIEEWFSTAILEAAEAGTLTRTVVAVDSQVETEVPIIVEGTQVPMHEVDEEGKLVAPLTFTLDDGTEIAVVGFADLVCDDTVLDWKSIGGYGFKLMVGDRGDPEGPKREAQLQTATYAEILEKDWVTVAYISKEAVAAGNQAVKKRNLDDLDRVYHQFTVSRASLHDEVQRDLARMWKINRAALDPDEPKLAKRMVPGVPGEIQDPSNGKWVLKDEDDKVVQTGNYFACAHYCAWRDRCIEDGPGVVEVKLS